MRYNEILQESAAGELAEKLPTLHKHDYNSIDKLMQHVSARHKITGKKLHDLFVHKFGHTPDVWIKKLKSKLGKAGVTEAFDQPYPMKWEKSEADDSMDALVKLPDGSNLSIMFNMDYDEEGEEVVQVEFWRNNSQEVTGEGDAQRVFATVLSAIQQYIKTHKTKRLSFSASKEVEPGQNSQSRANLYDKLVQRYARSWGYRAFRADTGTIVRYELSRLKQGVAEGLGQDYLSQIPNLSWKPVSRNVWNTIQDEGLDEEQDTPNHRDWVMASLSIDPKDAQALMAFENDAIEDFNRFDIHLKSRYPGLTDLIDYDRGTVTIVKPINKQGVAENFLDEGLRVDVPNEEWLQDAIDYAKQKSPDRNGLPYMGKTTATVRSVDVPVDILKRIPGMRREQQNVRQADLAAIIKIMSDTGKLPLGSHTGEEYKPFINVAYDGSAWVNEGNHRIMAAAKLGWKTLPVEISYFDGGERVESGAMYPPKIGLGQVSENINKKSNEFFVESLSTDKDVIKYVKESLIPEMRKYNVPITPENHFTRISSSIFESVSKVTDSGQDFLDVFNRLDQRKNIDIHVGQHISILNLRMSQDFAELFGFKTPKKITKIYRESTDKKIVQLEFNNDPEDVWPRKNLASFNGKLIMTSAFFPESHELEKALTVLQLSKPDSINLRTNISEERSHSALKEGVDSSDDIQKIKDFINWSIKQLHIQKPYPKITLSRNTKVAQQGHHTGVHTEDNKIWVYIENRNLIDIFRTIFHELVHERQSQLNMIKDGDSYPGSPIEAMADMVAGKYIKIYGKDHPEIFQ